MMADLGAAQAAEIAFRVVRASAVRAVSFRMVDAEHFVFPVQAIPRLGFVGIDDRSLGDGSANEVERGAF